MRHYRTPHQPECIWFFLNAISSIYLFIYFFIYLWVFTQDSLFSSNVLLSMRVQPYGISTGLAIFTTEGLTEKSNSGPLDPKLDALTTRPRIHIKIFTYSMLCRWMDIFLSSSTCIQVLHNNLQSWRNQHVDRYILCKRRKIKK